MTTKQDSSVGTRLREEFAKIHPQWTLPAAVFLALRGRHERKRAADGALKTKDRIGKVFSSGDVGVVILGDRGTRKTTLMRSIYEGLGLNGVDVGRNGDPMGQFVESAGMSTSVGLLQFFTDFPDSVLFLDEMDWDNSDHFSLFKQVSNGKIFRQKSGSTDPIEFSSLVVASTNSISMPTKKSHRQHLLAVLDRFYVLKAEPVCTSMGDIIDSVLEFDNGGNEADWDYLRECLTNPDYSCLCDEERAFVHAIAKEKERLILGPERDQTRNVFKMIDAVLFFKRMLGLDNVTQHEDVIECIMELIDAVIMFNPGTVVSMTDELDQILYDAVAKNDSANDASGVKLATITEVCKSRGIVVENEAQRRKLMRRLDNLSMAAMIVKVSRGRYSVRRPKQVETPKQEVLPVSPMSGQI